MAKQSVWRHFPRPREPAAAAKHAGVAEARVRIWREGERACVAVEDEGVGFGPAAGRRGFGLRERVGAGRGTRVVVRAPAAPGGEGGEAP